MKPYHQQLLEAKREILRGFIEEAGGCISKAAKLAGLNRTYFYKLVRNLKMPVARTFGNEAWRALQ